MDPPSKKGIPAFEWPHHESRVALNHGYGFLFSARAWERRDEAGAP